MTTLFQGLLGRVELGLYIMGLMGCQPLQDMTIRLVVTLAIPQILIPTPYQTLTAQVVTHPIQLIIIL